MKSRGNSEEGIRAGFLEQVVSRGWEEAFRKLNRKSGRDFPEKYPRQGLISSGVLAWIYSFIPFTEINNYKPRI